MMDTTESPTVPPVTRLPPAMETTASFTSPAEVEEPMMETTASAFSPSARVLLLPKLTRSLLPE
ncbi:MAG: hypothetical protein WDM96_17220 [Lacunisphaera sp.]